MSIDSIRGTLIQLLETERLFGVREVPVARRSGGVARGIVEATRAGAAASADASHARLLQPGPETLPQRPAPKPAPGTRAAVGPTPLIGASDDERVIRLRTIDETRVKGCTKCGLGHTRTHTVFGQGHVGARLVFVGEAPGFDEDQSGLAFVGKAGQLLTRMIEAMGLTRDDVFICNVLKCRPPDNRAPAPDEIIACRPYLFEQLAIIAPEVIIALGAPAAQTLLNTRESIGRLRGRFHDFYISGPLGSGTPVPLMPTYHPAYLLRSPGEKGKAWDDLQKVMAKLGLPPRR